jgi:sugar phosphate permease
VTLEERAFRKATRRLIPFLFLIYVVAYLDRVNVRFAQLRLEDDLGFRRHHLRHRGGIFSLGYVNIGVPSNLALARFGARRWLAGIMIVWGVISASMMFIESALLSGIAAAAGIALIAVLGNLGGFVGPAFTGIAEDSSGGYELLLVTLACILAACSLLTGPVSARSQAAPAQPARR